MYTQHAMESSNISLMAVIEQNNTTQIQNTTGHAQDIYIRNGSGFLKAQAMADSIFIYPLVMTCMLSVIGAVGNSIVLYVYGFKWKHNKTRLFILCLGVLDIINCVFNMPIEVAVLWHPLDFDQHLLCKISRGCTYVINNTGSLVFVAIAIDRYLIVYKPFRSRRLTTTWAKRMCFGAFVVAAVFSAPSFVFYGTKTLKLTTPVDHVFIEGKTCLISDDHSIHTGIILAYTLMLFTFLIIIFITLIVLYVAIGHKIYFATIDQSDNGASRQLCRSIVAAFTGSTRPRSSPTDTALPNKNRNESALSLDSVFLNSDTVAICSNNGTTPTQATKKRMRVNNLRTKNKSATGKRRPLVRRFSSVNFQATKKNTIMMRMVTIAFMLSFTPFLVIVIMRYTHPDIPYTWSKDWKIVYHLLLRSYFFNSAVNPWIYGFMNRQFRKIVTDMFRDIFCSRCCTKRNISRRLDKISKSGITGI